jgi:uncharacterized protein (TIGR03083 family)
MPEPAVLAEKLKAEGEKLAAFFAALDEHTWNAGVYTEGATWTVRAVLAHLVTAERGFVRLFESIREGGSGVSEDFSIDRYNARQQEKTRDLLPAELLAQFGAVRADMVAFVSGLQEADLERIGRHPFLKETSLREMIKMVYLHNQMHLRDLKRVLG